MKNLSEAEKRQLKIVEAAVKTAEDERDDRSLKPDQRLAANINCRAWFKKRPKFKARNKT